MAGPGAACGKPGKPHHRRALVGRRLLLAVERSALSVSLSLRAPVWQGSAYGQGAWRTCTVCLVCRKARVQQHWLSSDLACALPK